MGCMGGCGMGATHGAPGCDGICGIGIGICCVGIGISCIGIAWYGAGCIAICGMGICCMPISEAQPPIPHDPFMHGFGAAKGMGLGAKLQHGIAGGGMPQHGAGGQQPSQTVLPQHTGEKAL